MDKQVEDLINFRIDEFEQLTNEQLLLAAMSRIISGIIPPNASFEMAVGDLSLVVTMLVRAGGNKEEAMKYMFRERPKEADEEPKPE